MAAIEAEKRAVYRLLMGWDDPPEQREAVREVLGFFERWESERLGREVLVEPASVERSDKIGVETAEQFSESLGTLKKGWVESRGTGSNAASGSVSLSRNQTPRPSDLMSLFPEPLRYKVKTTKSSAQAVESFSNLTSVLLLSSSSSSSRS